MDSSPRAQGQPHFLGETLTEGPADTQPGPESPPSVCRWPPSLWLNLKALLPAYCQTPWGPGVLGLLGVLIQGPDSLDKHHLPGTPPSHQRRTIPPDRIQALIDCPPPKTKQELVSLLGLLNFFCIWIPNFSLIAKPLYKATKGSLDEPLFDPSSLASPIRQLTESLLQVPILHLPNYTRPFFLFAHSNQGQALGLLCHQAAAAWTPKACLSKPLDLVTKGWPPYIQVWLPLQPQHPKRTNSLDTPPHSLLCTQPLRPAVCWALRSLPPSRIQALHAFFLDPQLSLSPCAPLNLPVYYPHLQQTRPSLPQWVLPESPSNT